MSIRDELIDIVWEATGKETDASSDQGADWQRCEFTADAIIARFPYMSTDRSLYDYADSLREQLNAANKKLEKEKTR